MTNSRISGGLGESLAADYLVNHNYLIVKNNFFVRAVGEIDIIASKDDHLTFIEVKYSNSDTYGNPIYKVNKTKQKRIYKTAEIYLSQTKQQYNSYSFDVIIITKFNDEYKIQHLKNAFWGETQ